MTDTKKSEQKAPAPLEDPSVNVDVLPNDVNNQEHVDAAERLAEKLTEKIQEAIEENRRGGKDEQFEAAKSEVDKAQESADPQQIEVITVEVEGVVNDHGDHEGRAWSVTPKQNDPTP